VRIALISDIHGNEIALQRVLKEIDDEGVDATYCLGDLAPLGPHPRETIDIVRSRDIPCVMGNHDEFLLLPDLIRSYPTAPVVIDAVDWCRAELSTADLDFFRTFEREITIPLNGGPSICLFHGSPRSHMEMILATTPAAELDMMLDGRRGAVLAGGHTHIQMLRQHRGQLLVNAGSVGMPFEEHFGAEGVSAAPPKILDHAEYTLVHSRRGRVHVELRRVPLDRSLLYKAALDSSNPLRDMLAAQYA
jgi:predicted phosphodiesterase